MARLALWCGLTGWRKADLVRVDLAADRIVDSSERNWRHMSAQDLVQLTSKSEGARYSIIVLDLGSWA